MSLPGSRGWLLLAGMAGVVAIGADLAGLWMLYALTKPTTTIALWAWARSRMGDVASRRGWILLGLLLSLVGDVALMWPKEGFVPGLAAFLLAHLAYIVAFSRHVGFARRRLPFVVFGVIAAVIVSVLWPHIDAALRIPVLAYVVCLACMAAQAAVWWLTSRGTAVEPYARRAALGGVFFMVSDACLAFNKFMLPLPASELLVLATYWVAQALIAASLLPRDRLFSRS
jgi:uncharacterized membrane protein YhhN